MVQLEQQLQRLHQQLSQLKQDAAAVDQLGQRDAYKKLALLDERFACRSDAFTDYVAELSDDFTRLEQLARKTSDLELIQVFCDRFVGKFATLQKQLRRVRFTKKAASPNEQAKQRAEQWQVRLRKAMSQGDMATLQQKLNKQREFETQLELKITELNQALKRSHSNEDAARLGADLLTLQARLGQCRQTTWKIEQKINQLESRFKE